MILQTTVNLLPKPPAKLLPLLPLPTVLCKLTMMSLTSICALKAAPRWTIMECWLSQSVLQGKNQDIGWWGRRKEASAYRLSYVFAVFCSTKAQFLGSITHEERFKMCTGRVFCDNPTVYRCCCLSPPAPSLIPVPALSFSVFPSSNFITRRPRVAGEISSI